jgi:hypothetical protein
MAAELGSETVTNGDQAKLRSARQRVPVIAESEPLVLNSTSPAAASGVRPALALTAAEELETIRRVLLEAATSTSRETWATCTCPECGKSYRQEITVPDHGARIKAVETLLREGLGRVEEAEVLEPRMPTFVEELRDLSSAELEELREGWGRGSGGGTTRCHGRRNPRVDAAGRGGLQPCQLGVRGRSAT